MELVYHNVLDSRGVMPRGGILVLHGNAPVWIYCHVLQRAMQEGVAVIAVAPDLDITKDGDEAVVVYTHHPDYRIGRTLKHCATAVSQCGQCQWSY